jgi:transcription antitermination protein NusB
MSKPSTRRLGRELAVQCLFQLDHNSTPLEEALPGFLAFKNEDGDSIVSSPKVREFAEQLIRGVEQNREQIDRRIREVAENFELHRIGGIERAVIRLGIFELLQSRDVPAAVIINEAIELALSFSGTEARRFVNGVLDRVRVDIGRPSHEPASQLRRSEKKPRAAAETAEADPVDWMTKQMAQVAREDAKSPPGDSTAPNNPPPQ